MAISCLAAFGASVLLFQDAAGTGGLDYLIPFLMFVFLLALSEDYNILVMARIREEAGRMLLRQAMTRALEHTGSTVTAAGLVLAGTFGVFALMVGDSLEAASTKASSPLSRSGILMDAFAVRMLLVSSMVALLGCWNWWPAIHAAARSSPSRSHPARH